VSAGPPPTAHEVALADLTLTADARAALARYLDLVAAWNPRVNLTGARTPAERVAILVAPVAPVAIGVEPGLVLDVGSGNGSPGLVLAALRHDLPVTLLEPRQKRWAFLREAVRAVGRPDVVVLRVRHDGYDGPAARTVTMRALGLAPDALAPLLVTGGLLLAWGPAALPTATTSFSPEKSPASGVQAWRRR